MNILINEVPRNGKAVTFRDYRHSHESMIADIEGKEFQLCSFEEGDWFWIEVAMAEVRKALNKCIHQCDAIATMIMLADDIGEDLKFYLADSKGDKVEGDMRLDTSTLEYVLMIHNN